jgi:undecaprenyl-diphosphatase
VTELFQLLVGWVQANPLWAGAVIFLVAMAESLAVVGIVVPGVVIMFGVGALVATGALEFWAACAWAVAGAVTGDGLSFAIGRRLRDRVPGLWPFSRHPGTLERGVAFFHRYGGKSVAIGRFVGPVRAIIPLVAGMMGMPPARFVVANVLSALVWAPAYLLPGMVFGASLELASEVAFRLVFLLLTLAVLVWLVVWVVRQTFRLAQPHASAWLQAVLEWTALHPKLDQIARALADPAHPEARGLAVFATLLIAAMALFVALTGTLLGAGWPSALDHALFETMRSLRNPVADHLMAHLSRFADAEVVLALIAGVLAYLAVQRHWQAALYWLAASAFGMLASVILKYTLRIPRPDAGIEGLTPFSFPSTHAMRATVLYGFLAVMIARALNPRWRWMPYSLAGVLMVGVSTARVYFGAHWLSDVLASLTLGLAWVAALGIAYHRHAAVETHWRGLVLGIVGVTALAFTAQTWRAHDDDLARYTPHPPVHRMAVETWWEDGWDRLPARREDTRGLNNHPLSLQYAGDLEDLARTLEVRGWTRVPPAGWRGLLRLLSTSLPLERLPVLPQVHEGQHEALALVRSGEPGRRTVIRLWASPYVLTPGRIPLWVGNASIQQREELLGLVSYPVTTDEFPEAFGELEQAVADLPHRRPATDRRLVLVHQPGRPDADGRPR